MKSPGFADHTRINALWWEHCVIQDKWEIWLTSFHLKSGYLRKSVMFNFAYLFLYYFLGNIVQMQTICILFCPYIPNPGYSHRKPKMLSAPVPQAATAWEFTKGKKSISLKIIPFHHFLTQNCTPWFFYFLPHLIRWENKRWVLL